MIFTDNLDGHRHPARENGARLVASVDVEWTKNYQVPNSNRAFCYSVVWLTIAEDKAVDVAELSFSYTSVYVEHADECRELVVRATEDLCTVLNAADVMVGHQLCSDLGVLAANAVPTGVEPTTASRAAWLPDGVAAAHDAWHTRTKDRVPHVVDTRYDAGHILTGRSRRLVDVCNELGLDVTQPELGSRSMTALHQEWLNQASVEARERITVLNLRHGLSAALVALRALGTITWAGRLNINRLLERQLRGSFAWLDHPTFQALLHR